MGYTPRMRIVQTADLHLRGIDDERWEALVAVVDTAMARHADLLAISGDLFDRDIDAQQLRVAIRGELERFQRPVVIIPGNHDVKGIRDGDFFGNNVTLFTGGVDAFQFDDVNVIALPYTTASQEDTLALVRAASERVHKTVPNVLLFHGELLDLVPDKGAFGDEAGRDYMPVRLRAFDGLGIDYVLGGHFHSNHRIHQYDGGYFVYAGSPVSITRKELGQRHVTVVDTGKPPESIPIDTHHFIETVVTLTPDDSAQPIDRVEQALSGLHPRASVFLTVTGFADFARFDTNEQQLHDQLKLLTTRFPVRQVDALWQDVSAVLHHELYVRFKQRLATTDITDEQRAESDRIAIAAMMEALHAR